MVLLCVFLSLSLFVVHDLVKLSLSLFFFSCCATVCGELKMNIKYFTCARAWVSGGQFNIPRGTKKKTEKRSTNDTN